LRIGGAGEIPALSPNQDAAETGRTLRARKPLAPPSAEAGKPAHPPLWGGRAIYFKIGIYTVFGRSRLGGRRVHGQEPLPLPKRALGALLKHQ